MAIDQRQISDLSLLQTKFKMGTIMEGDEVDVILSHDAASNTYKMDFVFPSYVMNPPTSPEPTDPEPTDPEDPTPTDPEEPEPSEPEDTGPEYKAFSECTVDEMLEIIRAGKAQEYWNVGDVVKIGNLGMFNVSNQSTDYCLQGGITLYGIILGFNHNISIEHPKAKYSVSIGAFRATDNNVIGFGSITANLNTCNSNVYKGFYSALPFEWQSAILKSIVKYANGSSKTYSQGIFSLSYFEVHGSSNTFVNSSVIKSHTKEEQYDYFKTHGLSSITWSNPQRIGSLGATKSNFPIMSRNEYGTNLCVALNATSQNHAFKVFPINSIPTKSNQLSKPDISTDLRTATSQGLTEHNSCLILLQTKKPTYAVAQDSESGKYYSYLSKIGNLTINMLNASINNLLESMYKQAADFPNISVCTTTTGTVYGLDPRLLGYFASSALFLPCFDIG